MEKGFKIRQSLLDRWPKLTEKGLTVNNTSAKLVECIIAPYREIEERANEDMKQQLLERWPELTEKGLTVNSTSAKFVECIIAPGS